MPLYNDTVTLGVRADLTQFERDIQTATARAAGRMKPINLTISNGVSQPLGKITGDISQFNKSLDAASARVLAFSASVGIINGVVNGFKDLVKETIAVEKALTDINVVLNTNQKGLDAFSNSLFDIARNTSSSFKSVADAALEFSRQGLSVQETLKRTNDALILSRISGLDAADSVKTLTSALNGFNKEALDTAGIVNKLAAVDSNFAVSTKDISDALTRVGSSASDANVTFNELVATITAVQQTTSRGGAVIGNALKTIFTRISREGTIEQLRELGVAIDESQTGIEKLKAISAAVQNADKSTANAIKELAGGVFQINTVSAALGDLSKEYSVYDNALKVANSSTDEAIRRNQALNQTLSALTTQAGANIDQLLSKIGKISLGGNLKSIFAAFNNITESISNGLDGDSIGAKIGAGVIQGLGNFLTGPAAIVALSAFSKLVIQVGGDAIKSFRSIAGITTEADKQAVLTKIIGDRLAANAGLYEQQLLNNKGIFAIQQDILGQLTREAELRAAIARIAPNIASEVSTSLSVSKGIIAPRAAGGFVPAMVGERMAINNGVGGAPSSARPVFIPRFNDGTRIGPIVANSSEKVVENWMGGKGSAVLNQDMISALGGEGSLGKFGKVKNVAEGFMPNFSTFDIAGGKVNLRKKGDDIVLDEILGGFDNSGSRKSGTGIVREAFDLAISEGKKLGADNLLVDIINSKVASSLNNNPKFSEFGPFSIGKFRFPLAALAGGFVPSLTMTSPIGEAVSREASALVNQGYDPSSVKNAIKIGTSPVLQGPQNPSGFGVYNTLQGQTSLNKAFNDHLGQNLKTVGAANGLVPNLAGPFDTGNIRLKGGKFANSSITDALNQAIEETAAGGTVADIKVAIAKIKALQKQLNDASFKSVQIALEEAVKEARISANEFKSGGLQNSAGKFVPKKVTAQVNDLLRTAANTNSPVELAGVQKQLGDITDNLAQSSVDKVKKSLLNVQKISARPVEATKILAEDVFSSAQSKVGKRGLLSFTSANSILKNEDGFNQLPQGDQSLIRQRLSKDASANRRQSFERASLGIAFAGSLASPFIDQGAESLRKGGSPNAAAAATGASGALTGASFGAILGPEGAAIGAAIGAFVNLGKALDGSADKASDLTKSLDDLQAKQAESINGFSTYIQTQQKLNSIIEDGGKASDILAVRQELSRVFATISDPEVRKNIIATNGSIKDLGQAFAQAQAKGFSDKTRQEAITIAAQEKSNNTNFFGARTQSLFGGNAINDISRALVASAPDKSLKSFAEGIKNLDGTLSKEQFSDQLQKIGLSVADAGSLFDDLEKPLNRLLLLRGLRENLDISKQLEEATNASIRYKKSITDLNKTIGTFTALDVADKRSALGSQNNAFSVQQNAAQNAAGLKFSTAGQFAQSQLSTAFQTNQIRFSSAQDRTSQRLDLVDKLSAFVQQNRDKVNSDKPLSNQLDKFIVSGGQGDIGALADRLIRKGTGTGEDSKTFSELGVTLNDARNKLASIDDNEKTQISILRQNLDAEKQRIQIENKTNLLGGAEGQIGFSTSGFDRFRNRDANSSLQGSGAVGAFGRNENALGVLEFQKSFGGVDGLDVRKVIPNAQELVAKSIKDSLVEGFGRLNLPITGSTLKQFDSISQLSAAKQFDTNKVLTAVEIGQAVSASFKYDTVAAGNERAFGSALNSAKMTEYTSVVPEIRNFLVARFGLEKQRVELNSEAAGAQGKVTSTQTQIANLTANIEKITSAGAKNLRVTDTANLGIFNNPALIAANKADAAQAGVVSTSDIAQIAQIASQQIKDLIPSNGDVNKFRTNINGAANSSGLLSNEFLKTALVTQFGFGVDGKGKREIDDASFNKLITSLEKSGAVDLDAKTKSDVSAENDKIDALKKTLPTLQDQFVQLTEKVKGVNKEIDAANAKGGAGTSGNPFPRAAFNPSRLNASIPVSDFSSGFVQRFLASQGQSSTPFKTEQDKFNFQNSQTRNNNLNFGPVDTDTIGKLSVARQNLKDVGGSNQNIEDEIRSLETVVLRQAQLQQLTVGRTNPELIKAGFDGSFTQNSQKISSNQAQASFQDLVKQANDAFISGFATDSELTQIGIKISQSLADHVRAQIKLGVPEADAQKAGEAIREKIQKELDKLEIKLPKSKLDEFGQGFKSRTEELQKSFDDLGAVGANTADSLVNGFGDAFTDIATGAKSATDAVRGLLSSVASDLSKFFAKRAFAAIFSAASGNSDAGSFGGLFSAQGGLMKLASGGQTKGVPALVMGGERVFGPDTVRAYGVDFFKDLNAGKINPAKAADGGVLKGGSGYKDDLFHVFPEGSFVLQKAAVNKYGKDYLDSISSGGASAHAQGGKVQHAFFGALIGAILSKAITGAVVGAATAKLTGGDWKKGAIIGGITGGIAGGVGGYSAAQSATGSFGDQFGSSFSNGFSYLGFGDKKPAAGVGAPTSYDDFIKNNPNSPAATGSLSGANGGNATGLGNQALSATDTASKPSVLKNAGVNLLAGLGLALASSALSKKPDNRPSIIQGQGSVTTYNPDGSVNINTAGGNHTISRSDYTSSDQLQSLIAANGGQLPDGGLPKFAGGGVATGSGSVTYKDRSILDKINKQFSSYAMGGMIHNNKPVGLFAMGGPVDDSQWSRPANPYVSTGSGTKDDVKAQLKKGEFIMTDKATDFYGLNMMHKLNSMQLNKQDIEARSRGGILRFENGGAVESSPSSDKGLFSVGSSNGTPSSPARSGGGGGGNSTTNVSIEINMNGNGGATVSTKSSGDKKSDDRNSIDSQKFASKVKALFAELVDAEKRPGGSLSKDAINS